MSAKAHLGQQTAWYWTTKVYIFHNMSSCAAVQLTSSGDVCRRPGPESRPGAVTCCFFLCCAMMRRGGRQSASTSPGVWHARDFFWGLLCLNVVRRYAVHDTCCGRCCIGYGVPTGRAHMHYRWHIRAMWSSRFGMTILCRLSTTTFIPNVQMQIRLGHCCASKQCFK